MTVLSAGTIKLELGEKGLIKPFMPEKIRIPFKGSSTLSYGLSEAGYDIRLSETDESSSQIIMQGQMKLLVSPEWLSIPNDMIGIVHDKSTLARMGIAVQNTVLEPGWRGFITLEASYHGDDKFFICYPGMPIAQIIFHRLDKPTIAYEGKYQDQENFPVEAR